jgi:hypothetical protein
MHNSRTFHSVFWSGALCGIAAIWIAKELRRRRRPGPRLVVVRNKVAGGIRSADRTEQVPPKRDEKAGDTA